MNFKLSQTLPSADSPSENSTYTFLFLLDKAYPTPTVIPCPRLPDEQNILYSLENLG